MSNIFLIVAALILVALNGFFVAAEFSMVKLRQTRVRSLAKSAGYPGKILARVHSQLDAYLSACQLGITLASLGLGWIGEPAFASLLAPLFAAIGVIPPEISHAISFAFAFFVISFLHIVVGELAPKSLAIREPEKIGLYSAVPLFGFYWLMYPVIWILNRSANQVLRLAGLDNKHAHDAHYSSDELKIILRSSRPDGQFAFDEWKMMAQTMDLAELDVSELMRPIHELVAFSDEKSLQDNLERTRGSRFSRYPCFDREHGNVLGMIHLKDLFLAQQQGKSLTDLRAFLRPVQYVTPRLPALELLRRFRKGAAHFVLVGDPGQPLRGFLTLDNLLAALVGEIRDEFRQGDNDWITLDDGTLIGKGSLPIYTLERALGIDIENEEANLENVDSIGGLIMAKLGDIPTEKQKIVFNKFSVVVKKMNGPRIVMLRVYPGRGEDETTGDAA
jgi:CBS domain containing-hemolysin-like protein